MTPADPAAEWWTTSEVAEHLGLRVGTVSSYRQRGQMPTPDKTLGRTHLWRPRTILEWQRQRPRVGLDQETSPQPVDLTPANDEGLRWRVHGERTIYENRWVELSLVDVEPPDGTRFEHHVVTMRPAAIAAVLDEAGDRVLLMWRHRFPSDIWNWELPGGLVEDGEDPAVTAAREVEEETGYHPGPLQHIVTFEPVIGMVRSPHHVYIAYGAERVGEPVETTEMQCMEWVPMTEVMGLIADGGIRNAGTLVALLHILAVR